MRSARFAALAAAAALGTALAGPVAAQDDEVPQSNVIAEDLIRQLQPEEGEELRYEGKPTRTTRGLSISAAEPDATAEPQVIDNPSVMLEIQFGFDSAELTPQARRQLREVAIAMNSGELSGYNFLLEGHTDAVGSAEYNLSLSRRRARSAYDFLVREQGIAPDRVEIEGHGERYLLDPSAPDSAVNRRVEITNIGR